MAAPATPAGPYRNPEIAAREKAIKDRLAKLNGASKTKATSTVAAQLAAMKKKKQYGNISQKYDVQSILGANKGFAQSDYGVDQGAAIPYQIGTKQEAISASNLKPTPKPAKPKRNPIPKVPNSGMSGK